jgi:hypothetical protein
MVSNGPPEPEFYTTPEGKSRVPEGDLGKNVYSPKAVKEATWAVIADRVNYQNKGIVTGLEALDNVVLPMRPGEMIGILGYTSNFKTGLMNNIAHYHANRIKESGDNKQIVVRFDWEMSVEEQGVIDLARITKIDASKMMRGQMDLDEYDRLKAAADDREKLPLWLVGHSSEGHEKRPRMSMNEVNESMNFIVNKLKLKPVLVLVDYLQRVRRLKKEIREGYMDIVDDTKDLAIEYACPTFLGCQASRKVKSRAWRMPRPDDAAETANFEQSCDKGFSVWMPKNDFTVGSKRKFAKREYEVTGNMLLINMWKQKFGQAPWMIETYVNFESYEVHPVTYQATFMTKEEEDQLPIPF